MQNIRHLRTARKEYFCEGCGISILIGERYYRLFGSSDDNWHNPKPYEIKLCEWCGSQVVGMKDYK